MAVDIEASYRRYGPMVLRRCQRLLGDPEWATDAMHDVFVQLLRYQPRLEDRGLSSLLYQMATHVCLNHIRSRGRRPEVPSGELLDHLAHTSDERGRLSARSVLGRLWPSQPESTRAIAVMHLVDGMTLEEVAAEVGMSVSGVRKRLRKLGEYSRHIRKEDAA